jgi:hypothetical protein
MRMKMSYTASSGERAEVGKMLVFSTRRRKLTGVRPGCMIVATSRGVSTRRKLVVDPHPAFTITNEIR